MRFSSFAETISKGFQDWVVMAGDESRLEHYMAQHGLVSKNAGVDARLSGHFLEGQWAFPGEGRMPSAWIVKPVDVLKQG